MTKLIEAVASEQRMINILSQHHQHHWAVSVGGFGNRATPQMKREYIQLTDWQLCKKKRGTEKNRYTTNHLMVESAGGGISTSSSRRRRCCLYVHRLRFLRRPAAG